MVKKVESLEKLEMKEKKEKTHEEKNREQQSDVSVCRNNWNWQTNNLIGRNSIESSQYLSATRRDCGLDCIAPS